MTRTTEARHRALTTMLAGRAAIVRSARGGVVLASCGGLLAVATLSATAAPRAVVGEGAPLAAAEKASHPEAVVPHGGLHAVTPGPIAADLAAVAKAALGDPGDLAAAAVAAPEDVESPVSYAAAGFVGVAPPEPEPVVEPEPEPAAAPASQPAAEPATEPAAETPAVETAAESRSGTSASRSEGRQQAPAAASPSPTPAPAPKPEPEPVAPARAGGAETAIGWAYNHLGLPYVFGGTSSSGYDCSGFTKMAYAAAGVSLPQGSSAQYHATARVPLSQIQRGDLLFYSNNGSSSGIYHVAIYLGNGQVIHSLRDWAGGFDGSRVDSINVSHGLMGAGRP